MREKIKTYLEKLADNWDTYVLEDHMTDPIGYKEATDHILTLICEEIEKVETPEFYDDFGGESGRVGYELCLKKILSLLRSEK